MIPTSSVFTETITETVIPSRTHKINIFANNVSGFVDDLEAIKQSVYLILNTERYKFLIYSWDYGVELVDLIGQPMPYVYSELPRRITEALIQDTRITDVIDFQFNKNGNSLLVSFTVVTNIGNIPTDLEVQI